MSTRVDAGDVWDTGGSKCRAGVDSVECIRAELCFSLLRSPGNAGAVVGTLGAGGGCMGASTLANIDEIG
eukprot:15221426-Ditylum_brightwellii.AAC.1